MALQPSWFLAFVYFVFFVIVKKEPQMNTDKERFDIRVDPRPSVVLKCATWDLTRHLLSQSQM